MGKAEIYEHMYVYLCMYVRMYICISNHICILSIHPPVPLLRLKDNSNMKCEQAVSAVLFHNDQQLCVRVCVSLNKPTSN